MDRSPVGRRGGRDRRGVRRRVRGRRRRVGGRIAHPAPRGTARSDRADRHGLPDTAAGRGRHRVELDHRPDGGRSRARRDRTSRKPASDPRRALASAGFRCDRLVRRPARGAVRRAACRADVAVVDLRGEFRQPASVDPGDRRRRRVGRRGRGTRGRRRGRRRVPGLPGGSPIPADARGVGVPGRRDRIHRHGRAASAVARDRAVRRGRAARRRDAAVPPSCCTVRPDGVGGASPHFGAVGHRTRRHGRCPRRVEPGHGASGAAAHRRGRLDQRGRVDLLVVVRFHQPLRRPGRHVRALPPLGAFGIVGAGRRRHHRPGPCGAGRDRRPDVVPHLTAGELPPGPHRIRVARRRADRAHECGCRPRRQEHRLGGDRLGVAGRERLSASHHRRGPVADRWPSAARALTGERARRVTAARTVGGPATTGRRRRRRRHRAAGCRRAGGRAQRRRHRPSGGWSDDRCMTRPAPCCRRTCRRAACSGHEPWRSSPRYSPRSRRSSGRGLRSSRR
uniref:LigA n=1 Tax=Mycobacterium sp. (strain MCS) TaxID=164756 RepID=A0A5Q5BEX8_MYCSS